MRKASEIALLCVLCAGCAVIPAPHIPSGAARPYQPPPQAQRTTVPADFPSPENARRVCRQVDTSDGSKRVCMWQRRH